MPELNNEWEHYQHIKSRLETFTEHLRKSREMHDNLKARMDMARSDAAAELITEVEEYLNEYNVRP